MGTWGTGNFDNDMALDWVFELEKTDDLSLVESTIDRVIDEEYIDSDAGEEAVVAIEVIARLQGNSGTRDAYAEDLDNWIKSHKLEVPTALVEKSKKALEKIVSAKSELYELWKETENFEAWKREINNLRVRLN